MRRPRIIVIGAGHLGTYHLAKLADHPDVVLAGVVERDPERLQAARTRHDIPGSHDMATFAGACDAAVLATPTPTHAELGERALRFGWHLLVEKPLAATAAQAFDLVKLAHARQRVLQVGHVERFNPAVDAALRVADRPRYIVAERLGPFTGRSTDVDVILDLMIHDLDIVASLVDAPLHEVRAVGVPLLTTSVDMASARLAFADGTVAQLSAGRASLESVRKLRLFTVERYMSIDCQTREVKSVRRTPANDASPWPSLTGDRLDVAEGDALALQDADFVRCVRTGETPRVDGAAGLKALQLAESVKRELKVPLERPS